MPYKVSTIQCPNCKSECEGVYKWLDNSHRRNGLIQELVGVNCFVCGFKKKIESKIISCKKVFQKNLI